MMNRKEIKSKTITQSNDATSINYRHGKIKRAKRHSNKKLRQLIEDENNQLRQEIQDKGVDKKLENQTGLTLEDLENLPPMSFEEFSAFIDKKRARIFPLKTKDINHAH